MVGGKVGGSWFYSRVGDKRVSPKFHLFVFNVNQGKKRDRMELPLELHVPFWGSVVGKFKCKKMR